jgi:hypothetical protein
MLIPKPSSPACSRTEPALMSRPLRTAIAALAFCAGIIINPDAKTTIAATRMIIANFVVIVLNR